MVNALEERAGDRPATALDDPLLALDLLAVLPVDPAVVGRTLAFLRHTAGTPAPDTAPLLRLALREYREGGFTALSPNTRRTYGTWLDRLDRDLGNRAVADVTTGDLVDLIARYAPQRRSEGRARRMEGVGSARTAATAFRHAWHYFASKGYADAAVAQAVPKPRHTGAPNRRCYRPAEAALVRHLAASAPDPMLDTLVVLLAERALLRRGEICALRLCDLHLEDASADVWGKGDRPATVPLTPALVTCLRAYVEDRRPPSVPPDVWRRSTALLLRRRPTRHSPTGRPLSRRYIEQMLARYQRLAPELYADGALCLHTFRHTAATWLAETQSAAVAQAALRHRPNTATAHYVLVSHERLRAALTAYETHVLAWHADDTAAA